LDKIQKIDQYYIEQLAYFMEKMKGTEDVDGKSLLHNSMIVYGSGIADGDRHSHSDLPVILAGNGGGAFETGRYVDLGEEVPLSNLYVRMLNEFGSNAKSFGDSTGALKKI
jgi:hypothetical protein